MTNCTSHLTKHYDILGFKYLAFFLLYYTIFDLFFFVCIFYFVIIFVNDGFNLVQ